MGLYALTDNGGDLRELELDAVRFVLMNYRQSNEVIPIPQSSANFTEDKLDKLFVRLCWCKAHIFFCLDVTASANAFFFVRIVLHMYT